jgi:CRP-like cAMP-binding protein
VGTPAFAGGVNLLSLLSSAKQRLVLEGSKRAAYRAGIVAFRPGPPGRAFLLDKGPPLTGVQAVIDSTFTLLDIEMVRRLAATDIDVITAIATHLAERVHYDLRVVAVRTLGTISERLAFDLLDRASQSQLADGRLEARATHEDLA